MRCRKALHRGAIGGACECLAPRVGEYLLHFAGAREESFRISRFFDQEGLDAGMPCGGGLGTCLIVLFIAPSRLRYDLSVIARSVGMRGGTPNLWLGVCWIDRNPFASGPIVGSPSLLSRA